MTGICGYCKVPNVSGQEQDLENRVTANFQAEFDRLGFPVAVVARKMGVSEKQIIRWRSGENTPQYRSVERIAAFFDRDPEWFYADHSDDRVAA